MGVDLEAAGAERPEDRVAHAVAQIDLALVGRLEAKAIELDGREKPPVLGAERGVVHMPCIGHVVSDRPLPAGGLAETQLLGDGAGDHGSDSQGA